MILFGCWVMTGSRIAVLGVGVLPLVGSDDLADFFVVDVIFGDVLDFVHGPYWFSSEVLAKIFIHESVSQAKACSRICESIDR